MSQPKETSKEKAAGEEPLIMPLEVVEGLHIPHVFRSCNRPLAEHVQLLKALEMREDDVLVLTYPKSGTHLTWEITSMLLAGKAEYEKRSKVLAMLEATPIEDLESAASPRVLNSHLLPRLLPRQIAAKKVKVIHAYRNVKDAFVSAFFHYRQIPGAEDLTMEKLEKPFFSGKGTHWIWEVISMLLSGKAEYEKRAKEFAMMEATQIEKLDSEPSPRVLNTHLLFHILPRQIKEKKVKVVHVYRNAKDVLVSAYFHVRQAPGKEGVTLEEVEKMIAVPEAEGGSYFTYLKEMDEFRKNNPDISFLAMSFEDTKEDPGKAVKNLAEFLGLEASPQLCADIVQATSFSNMKEADKTKQRPDLPGDIKMYRKGEVGDWKNYLTVAQSERIDAAMSCLKSCDYHFRFTL